MIDRLTPTMRPAGKCDGTQRWESLLFCHWEIDPDDLACHLPSELRVDTFAGRAYVGIVPFKMRDIRPWWLPKRFAFNFLETNVRTYVTHNGRPGVYFFSLDANSRLAVTAARIGWSLPYFNATMECRDGGDTLEYHSHRAGGASEHSVSFSIGDRLGESQLESLEHFLFERYLLFVQKAGSIYSGQVHHSPYEVHEADVTQISDKLLKSAGLPDLGPVPCLTHYSPGVDVEVFAIRQSNCSSDLKTSVG